MVSLPTASGPGEGGAGCGALPSSRGSSTSKVEPAPGALRTTTPPPDCFTTPCTVASPSPAPLPGALVVKNGSKTRARVASSMPAPVSVTESVTYAPGATPAGSARAASSTAAAVRTVMAPPAGRASWAFMTRFSSTCSSWTGSASTSPGSAPSATWSSTPWPTSRRSIFSSPATTRFRSSGSGRRTCLRPKASSCRVSAEARPLASSTAPSASRTSPPAGSTCSA
ncbi:MAG: hypothetical protein QM767_22600 [Anaeromyxobacter sp.]